MPTLNPPPNSPTWDYTKFKDWLFKLFKWVIGISSPFGSTGTAPQDGGYSNTVALSSALLDGPGTTSYSGNIVPSPDGGYSNTLMASGMVEGGLSLLPAYSYLPAKLIVFNSSGPSIPNAAFTSVGGWTVATNLGGGAFNTSTGVYTVPTSGFYLVTSAVFFVAGATWTAGNTIEFAVYQNGSSVWLTVFVLEATITTSPPTMSLVTLIQCNAGDTLQVELFQNSGGARSLSTTATANWLHITQVA